MKSFIAVLWGACLVGSCMNGDKDGYSTICYITATLFTTLYWGVSEYQNHNKK